MGVFFSGTELIDIAVGIERNGAAFYEAVGQSVTDRKAKELYEYLANEERKHLKVFQSMGESVSDYRPPEAYTVEYGLYLKALVDSAVFRSDQSARQRAQEVSSEAEAIQIASEAEKDSILFYSELRDLVRHPERELVDGIIDEERFHLRQLSELNTDRDRNLGLADGRRTG